MADVPADFDARIEALEERVTYQDDVIEKLNAVIVEQWTKLTQLQNHLARLEHTIREAQLTPGPTAPQDEPPPPHW